MSIINDDFRASALNSLIIRPVISYGALIIMMIIIIYPASLPQKSQFLKLQHMN